MLEISLTPEALASVTKLNESLERLIVRLESLQAPTTPEHSLVPIREAAALLKMTPATIRKKVRTGEWPCFGRGKSMRIDPNEIRAILRRERQGA